MNRRRAQAPPPPRPQSATDPISLTTVEWREQEREKAAARQEWAKRVALALTVPLLAGGFWAFPLVYGWVFLCRRWPRLRVWGVLAALPALGAVGRWWDAVLGPTGALVTVLFRNWSAERTVTVWVPWLHIVRPPDAPRGELAVSEFGLRLVPVLGVNPLPLFKDVALAAWPTGLVLACALCAAWGVAGLLEGPGLRSRTVGAVLDGAKRLRRKGGDVAVVAGVVLVGYIGMLYAPEGGGKTEWLLAMIAASVRGIPFCGLATRRAKWYLLTEQTDTTLEPYLTRWGLHTGAASGQLRIVTQEDAEKLWRAHGHETRPSWEHFGPIALDDAGRWGADVFVIDTWTFWVGSGAGASMIDEAMAPLKVAMRERGFAQLIFAHTNKDGDLLGNKEFRRLCDIAIKMLVPRGKDDPLRVFVYDKDRSGTKPGPHFGCERDLTTDPPSYRVVPVTKEDLEPSKGAGPRRGSNPHTTATEGQPVVPLRHGGTAPDQSLPPPPANVIDLSSVRSRAGKANGGVGGVSPGEKNNERTNERKPSERTVLGLIEAQAMTALRAGGTVGISSVELGRVLGMERNRLHRLVTKLSALGLVERAGKDGKAATWRCVGMVVAGEQAGEGGSGGT